MRQYINRYRSLAVLSMLALLAGCATPTPPGPPAATFIEPADGAVVGTTFKVRFGIRGMKVEPAGDVVANSGHNHLLINRIAIPAGETIPLDDKNRHYSMGQTEAMISLPPGQYKLTTQFADGAHKSYGPAMSSSILITVK